ncbi:hypothetical protein VTK56DRAFT_3993 [Thermocarpiscus australiensis]
MVETQLPDSSVQPDQERPTTPQVQDFVQHVSINPNGVAAPTPYTQTGVLLLDLERGNQPVPAANNDGSGNRRSCLLHRVVEIFHELMIGSQRPSLLSYATLLATSFGAVIAFSSIVGWPRLPVWDFLGGRTG